MKKTLKIADRLRLLAAGLASLYLAATLLCGVCNWGSLVLGGLCGLLWGRALTARGRGPLWLGRCLKWLCRLGWGGALACCGAMVALTLGSTLPAGSNQPVVIVVPGAQVNGSAPSQMLQNRLDAALEVWKAHPGSCFVVSGGAAAGADYTEADVMAMYLYHRGVEAGDIFAEHTAANTEQNLRFSAELIRAEGLAGPVVLATDSFHQSRCRLWAARCGLEEVYAAPCRPCWGIAPVFWLREVCGLAAALVFC